MAKAYIFDLEVKGQHRIGNMNVHVTSSHGERLMCHNGKPMSNQKIVMGQTQKHKFDLQVKVQGRIWIMNVQNTLSYGDTPMCQIWLANVKP